MTTPFSSREVRRLDYLEQNAKAPPTPQPYGRNQQAPPFRRTETRESLDFSRRGSNSQQGGRPARKCYECRSPDHLVRACPCRQPAPTETTTEPNLTETANLRYISGGSNAYLPLMIHGKSVMAVVDTGSDLSLVPTSMVRPRLHEIWSRRSNSLTLQTELR